MARSETNIGRPQLGRWLGKGTKDEVTADQDLEKFERQSRGIKQPEFVPPRRSGDRS